MKQYYPKILHHGAEITNLQKENDKLQRSEASKILLKADSFAYSRLMDTPLSALSNAELLHAREDVRRLIRATKFAYARRNTPDLKALTKLFNALLTEIKARRFVRRSKQKEKRARRKASPHMLVISYAADFPEPAFRQKEEQIQHYLQRRGARLWAWSAGCFDRMVLQFRCKSPISHPDLQAFINDPSLEIRGWSDA
jgi:hypothetical protein